MLTYKTRQCVGFFTQTYKTKQNTIQTRPFVLRDCKKASISILFQKVFLGWKLSPIINRQGIEIRMSRGDFCNFWIDTGLVVAVPKQGVGHRFENFE